MTDNNSDRGKLIEAYAQFAPRLRRAGDQRSVEADDVVQGACLRVIQRPEPETIEDPVRYLLRVARNLFIDRHRSKARESALFEHSGDYENLAGQTLDPERILAGKQRLGIVVGAIEHLPPRCREAFTLHRFEGLSYAAIARRMNISTSMVEKHIAEAMLRLSRALAQGEAR